MRGPARPTLLRLDRVTCSYGGAPVLVNASLVLPEGGFVGVVGPSGSGKTTLLRVVLGSLRPLAGEVFRLRSLRIGYVPQLETINWSFPATVGETVLMARYASRLLPWASPRERADVAAILGRLGIGDLVDRHIRQLSGGQQQRVFIARALAGRPQILLMDEPTSGVDVRTRHDVLHLLQELNAEGLTIIVTTHDLNNVAAHLPRLVCLRNEIVAEGAPQDVLRPDVLERTYGAPMDVLEHAGMPLVIPRPPEHHDAVVPIDRAARRAEP